jgi:cell division septation protein DedD
MKYFQQKRAETGEPWRHGAYNHAPPGQTMENRITRVPGSGFKRFLHMLDNNFWLLAGMTLGITVLIMGWWIISGEGPDGIRLFDRPQQASEQAPQKSGTVSEQAVGQLENQLTGLVDRVNMLTDSLNYLESKLIRAHVLTDSIITAERHASSTPPKQPAADQTARRVEELPSAAMGQRVSNPKPAETHQVNATQTTITSQHSRESATAKVASAGAQDSQPRGAASAQSSADPSNTASAKDPRTNPDQPREVRKAAVIAHQAPAARHLPVTSGQQGPWVVNLSSMPSQADAERLAAMARSRGIETQQQQVTVKGKDYWRVQTTGFPTAAEAQTYAGTVREKLELPDVWITRR